MGTGEKLLYARRRYEQEKKGQKDFLPSLNGKGKDKDEEDEDRDASEVELKDDETEFTVGIIASGRIFGSWQC